MIANRLLLDAAHRHHARVITPAAKGRSGAALTVTATTTDAEDRLAMEPSTAAVGGLARAAAAGTPIVAEDKQKNILHEVVPITWTLF